MNDPFHILLVEDNEGDVVLTSEALTEGRVVHELSIVRDGESAIDFVNAKGDFIHAKRPDLILLDINLPRVSGIDVLKNLKSDEATKKIPVVILTTSSSPTDVNASYGNHANAFITKAVGADGFIDAVRNIETFWFTTVTLPPRD